METINQPHCDTHTHFEYDCIDCGDAATKAHLGAVAKATRRDQPGSDLTIRQKKAAATLRAKRPMCIPGTNAIIRESEASAWHDLVTKAAIDLKLNPQQIPAFCDLAGVAS